MPVLSIHFYHKTEERTVPEALRELAELCELQTLSDEDVAVSSMDELWNRFINEEKAGWILLSEKQGQNYVFIDKG
jgi:ribonuclease HI